ncbi:endo-1,4-beta-xylanase [Sphingomonas sp. G-3-2-10]|uniref:endo-1,4-beta-xylanase n=1 Tax=Sphingomonas sp. G-3-2-10 TaxID=2728838 RepID=UPI00146AB6AC|nr:endo-1,4-beta-xylanase [Sphingomonas sp. G-3-2-10]NML05699.1 endo-1,4-beta-xylanase [Sphingomonas sp. G-3-2-10]
MTGLTRREMLAAGAATAAMTMGGTAMARAAASGLDTIAKTRGMRFGSAVAFGAPGADRGSFANPAYAAILERDCGLLVPENELKWQWTRHTQDYDFRQFDAIVDYASAKGFRTRGHTLFWAPQKWFPEWLVKHDFGPQPAKAAETMLADHVRTVCKRYGAKIYSYDVVNEAVEPSTGALRDTVVTRAFGSGEAMLDLMFHTARAEAPHAELVYNDYMSWERGTEDETHIAGVLKLLEGFRKRGTPVDTLGIQSHIRLLKDKPVAEIVKESEGPWRHFLDAAVAMGYKLVITEFDVNDKKAPTDIAARDIMVADYAKAYLDVMFSYPQLKDVLAWGMVDKYSWLTGFDPRADKTMTRGCPYDAEFKAKPLHAAIGAAFAGAPAR